ncbi:MAG: sigma-54-dependent transcriptional regulator [Gammaproteobacteria bacterium]
MQEEAATSQSLNETPKRILIVEDEALFARAVGKRLKKAGHDCHIAPTLADARRTIGEREPDMVLLDMRLPDGSGLDFLEELRAGSGEKLPVVVLTAHGELEDAVAAMKLNAVDYLKKPIDLDELVLTLDKALDTVAITRQLDLSREREQRAAEPIQLLGDSAPMQLAREQIERICKLSHQTPQAPPTVLLVGETGSGKDVAARLLHQGSALHNRPFVHVDCAALPKDLIETELFGHEKGAYTSAHSARTGLIEAAENGIVFLDEIAELPLDLQPKLLAAIERRTVRRVGSTRERQVAAWFIAATNRDLEAMVAAGELRSDLYYRLKVLTLSMPPLRERDADAVTLARHFVALTARRYGLPTPELDANLIANMRAYHWPGNIRELRHLVERAVLLSGGETLTSTSMILASAAAASKDNSGVALHGMTLEQAEATLIEQALDHCKGNVSEAARQLGITRMAMRYRMQKHQIE